MKFKSLSAVLVIIFALLSVGLLVGLFAHQASARPALPTWQQVNTDGFGDIHNNNVLSLAPFGDDLYAGVLYTENYTTLAEVYRRTPDGDWILADTSPAAGINALVVFNGSIYAGSGSGTIRASTDGIQWTEVITDGFGNPENRILNFVVYSNTLYADGGSDIGAEIWRTTDGSDWEEFIDAGMGDMYSDGVVSSEIFSGQLYWGVSNWLTGAKLWRTNGITTTVVINDGLGNLHNEAISSLAVFGDDLYASIENNYDGVQLWRSANGTDWAQIPVEFPYSGFASINGMVVFNQGLYLVLENDVDGLEVWRTFDGTAWSQVNQDGFGDINNSYFFFENSIAVRDGGLFIGTHNHITGAEVWRMTPEAVPPGSITLEGTNEGVVGEAYVFTATVEPISTTLPLTYTWMVTGQEPCVRMGGIRDIATLTFPIPGDYLITVNAANPYGEVETNHGISISEVPISGLTASNDSPTPVGDLTHFSAVIETGTNVTYSWEFGDGTFGEGEMTSHAYQSAGYFTATVTAANSVNQLTASMLVNIYSPAYQIYLPTVFVKPPPPETGKIVFVSTRDGNDEIYSMNYDGSGVVQLTDDISMDHSPDWSPDGTKIAFTSDRSGESEIYIMDANGNNQVQVTTLTNCHLPQWSPDGTRIAFSCTQDFSNPIIYTINPDGTGLFQVTDEQLGADGLYWSPDGLQIAFQSILPPGGIFVIDADGTDVSLLTQQQGLGYFAWSPDGTRLVLSKAVEPNFNFDLYLYDIDSSVETRLTETTRNHNSVDWSPGGSELIFHSNRDDISNFEIYTLALDDLTITNLTNNPAADSSPDWTR